MTFSGALPFHRMTGAEVAAIHCVQSAERMRIPIAVAGLLTYGCSTSIHVQQRIPTDAVERIAPVMRGDDATVVYARGRIEERNCGDVVVTSENVRWSRANGDRVAAPIGAVSEISICEPGCRQKGALIGMGAGAAIGTLLSALVVFTCNSSANLCSLWWIPGPMVGIILGALIGAHGTRTTVHFEQAAPER